MSGGPSAAAPTSTPRGRYVAWVGVSQALNAATNLLLTIQLARLLSVRGFATTAIGLAALQLVLAGLRGMSFEPAVVHGDLSRSAARQTFADSGLSGLVVAACIVISVLAMKGPVLVGFVLAVGAILTLVQDAARWLLFGLDEPRRAAGLDALWAAVQVGFVALSFRSPLAAAAGWAAGAGASAVAGVFAVRRHAHGESGRPALRVWQWGLEHLVAAGALQLAVILAPLTGGVEVAGGLRGAMSLLGVASILLGAAQQAVTGRLRWVNDDGGMWLVGVRTGAVLGVLVALACLPMLAISDGLGRSLLGATWAATRVVLPILIVQKVAVALSGGPTMALRRRAGHTVGVWWRTGLTALTLAAVLVGASLAGAAGAAWALAGGGLASIPIWTALLWRASHTPTGGPVGRSADV